MTLHPVPPIAVLLLAAACGGAPPTAVEEPVADPPLATAGSSGGGAGHAGGSASGGVELEQYLFDGDDVVEGDLLLPEGTEPPPAGPGGGVERELLERAEALFEAAEIARAAEVYERVVAGTDPGLAAYARYKLAWCRFNLQDFEQALAAIVDLIESCDPPTSESQRNLRREAIRDLPRFYALPGRPDRAEAFFARFLSPEEVDRALERLADHYEMDGKLDDATLVRRTLCARRPERCPLR